MICLNISLTYRVVFLLFIVRSLIWSSRIACIVFSLKSFCILSENTFFGLLLYELLTGARRSLNIALDFYIWETIRLAH